MLLPVCFFIKQYRCSYVQSGLEHIPSTTDYIVYFWFKLKLQIWIKTEMLMKDGQQEHNYCRDATAVFLTEF